MRLLAGWLVVAWGIEIPAAHAQGNAGAEKLFDDGRGALDAGRVAEACDLFTRSHSLEPRVGTLLNIGDCRERLGQTATAWAAFVEARTLATTSGDPRGAEANRRAAALEPRLAYLTIRVPPDVEGLVVMRRGEEVAAGGWGVALPTDPGDHPVEARAPGFLPWIGSVHVDDGGRAELQVPPLRADPSYRESVSAVTPTATAATWQAGAGLALGVTSDSDLVAGPRGFGELVLSRRIGIRGSAQLLYARYDDENSAFAVGFDVGLAGRYQMLKAVAGLGMVLNFDRSDTGNATYTDLMVRIDPVIVRVGPLELGLHLQIVFADKVRMITTFGVDYVAW